MVKRSIVIGTQARLSIDHSQLTMSQSSAVVNKAPLEDLSIIVLDTPEVTLTSALLAECGERGIALVVCGSKHLPSSILMPFVGNHLVAHVQRRQLEAKLPTKKRIWQTIIQSKLSAQAEALRRHGKDPRPILRYLSEVRSGDSTNREGVAAATYFPILYGPEFIRDPELDGLNSRLNYGYAILRAAVARAVVLSGLNPSVGIWHHNRFNAFALADDLIEPLRPVVDLNVYDSLSLFEESDLTPKLKRHLLQILTVEVGWEGGRFPLDTALQRYCAQVRDALLGNGEEVQCPTL